MEIHFVMILFLSDVSGSEIFLILFFVLIFFGSKSIPNLARTMGRTIRQIKDASDELQNEIKKSGMDIKKDLNLGGIIEETAQEIERPIQNYTRELDEAIRFEPPTVFEAPENLSASDDNEDADQVKLASKDTHPTEEEGSTATEDVVKTPSSDSTI